MLHCTNIRATVHITRNKLNLLIYEMSFQIVDENVEYNPTVGFLNSSCFEVDDIRRLSLYATLRADDLENIRCGGDHESCQKKKGYRKTEKTRTSLQELFTPLKPIQLQTGEPIQEESSSTESLNREDEYLNLVVTDPLGIEYNVKGIKRNEFPVIGFHLDDRICPGFKYQVRSLDCNQKVFDGEPRVLQSIGMGYGKRLTFKSDRRNLNECYFWTDNNPEGFGFSISAISKGDNFMIYDSMNQSVGEVVVESVEGPQVEESMTAYKGDVRKMVRVRFTCTVHHHIRFEHNLDIANAINDIQVVEGLVELVKTRKLKEATVVCIKDVFLNKIGQCTLWNDAL